MTPQRQTPRIIFSNGTTDDELCAPKQVDSQRFVFDDRLTKDELAYARAYKLVGDALM